MIQSIVENNREITQILKKGSDDRQRIYEIQMLRAETESKKVAVAEFREENKILLKDLDSIPDPSLREFIRSEQLRIMEKRSQQRSKESQNSSTPFSQYFDGLGGSGNDLPDY